MSLGGGSPNASSASSDALAAVSREAWNDYRNRYVPIENRAIDTIIDREVSREEGIGRSDVLTEKAYDNASAAAGRSASRYGGMTSEQRESFDKRMDFNKGRSTVNNRNKTRDRVDDRLIGLEGAMVNVGRATQGQAVSGFGSNAALESRRNRTNQQLAAQSDAAKTQLAGTVAGIGLAAAII